MGTYPAKVLGETWTLIHGNVAGIKQYYIQLKEHEIVEFAYTDDENPPNSNVEPFSVGRNEHSLYGDGNVGWLWGRSIKTQKTVLISVTELKEIPAP